MLVHVLAFQKLVQIQLVWDVQDQAALTASTAQPRTLGLQPVSWLTAGVEETGTDIEERSATGQIALVRRFGQQKQWRAHSYELKVKGEIKPEGMTTTITKKRVLFKRRKMY